MARLLDYLRLLRFPNLFTALADVLMGYCCVHQAFTPPGPLVGLLAASGMMYLAGMVLNDVFDVERDRHQRPDRPLPAGRISLRTARALGFALLVGGVAAAWGVALSPLSRGSVGASGLVALALAGCILTYDAGVKATVLGPIFMGACRSLNVLLGASFLATGGERIALAGFPPHALIAAAGIGLYIVGVTWYARRETEVGHVWPLAGGVLVMLGGLALLTLLPRGFPAGLRPNLPNQWWLLMLALLGTPIIRRSLMALADPSPARVQAAVKHCLMSIIILDAAIVFLTAGGTQALVVLSLLPPAMLLGRWVYST